MMNSHSDPCPPGTPVPGCQGPNLCLGQTCPNYPNAQCKLDACGSCHVVFYNGKTRLTEEDCFGELLGLVTMAGVNLI